VEIGLRPFQFCNLCEINVSDISSEEDFLLRVKAATLLGTLQAGFTNFHYLRPVWKKTTEKDALLGIGMTGIASNHIYNVDLTYAATLATNYNKEIAESIGINPAARVTCVKPSGTTSCVLGTSSGIHAWHNDYYIRRCEFSGNNPIVEFFKEHYPQLIKPLVRLPGSYAIEIPCKAPENATTRKDETANSLLERVKYVTNRWVKPGHISGINSHNVSTTIYVRDEEWNDVGKWMWDNRDNFNGMAVLPFDGGTYKEAPFEDITKDKYDELMSQLPDSIDWSKLIEEDDATQFVQEIACAGGVC
jgi:ribonucleoside-diphosphate reductase alpha chain